MNLLFRISILPLLFCLIKTSLVISLVLDYYISHDLIINNESHGQGYQRTIHHMIYDMEPNQILTFQFGELCLSQNVRISGFINIDGALYTTSETEMWVTPNSEVLHLIGPRTINYYKEQIECSELEIIKHQAN